MAGDTGGPRGHMRWLITYADLITLLMIFFVMLYSIAQVDRERYARLVPSLRSALGGGGSALVGPPPTPAAPPLAERSAAPLVELGRELAAELASS